MSSFDETELGSDDDVAYPTVDLDSSEEIPDLEEADQIDDDERLETLKKKKEEEGEEDVEDELDMIDVEADADLADPRNVITNIEDRNHKIIQIVAPDDRITSHFIQRPEMTEAIGIRTSQIEQGSEVFTDVTGYTDPIMMAKKEFIDRKSPLIVERALEDTPTRAVVEQWKVREMTFPITNREILMITQTSQDAKSAKSTKTGKGEDPNDAYMDERFG
jgi:hypothetical protein